jgi:hypothetical protein
MYVWNQNLSSLLEGKDIVFKFIIEYSSLMILAPS